MDSGRPQASSTAGTSASDGVVLTIDLGTSGPKVATFTLDGTFLDGEFEPVALIVSPGGGVEQRPQDWWDGVRACAARLAARGALPRRPTAVSVTSQWSGTVAVDAGGHPLHNAVIWMDSRGARQIGAVVGGPITVQGYDPRKLRTWIRLTGGAPSLSGKDPLSHILWLRAERPELTPLTSTYLEPKDWLNLQLTGRVCATHDSIVVHWLTDNRDPRRIDYSDELLALTGVPRECLPDLVPATSVIGTVTAEAAATLGIDPGVPVVGGTPDVQSALLGSGAVDDFAGHLYIGTSSWLTCHVPFKRTDVLHQVASLPSPVPGRYFVADEQELAGGCLNWLRDQVLYPGDGLDDATAPADLYRRLDELADTAPAGSGGVLFTPWLNGERTPVDDHTIRGGWHHLGLESGRPAMVRSVLEGVAYNSRWLLESVERFTRRPFPELHLIGGGANSGVWCQILADVLDRPVRQVEHPVRANARGAALLASLTLGHIDEARLSAAVPIEQTFTPDHRHRAVHEANYTAFRAIYRRNRGIHRRLSGFNGGGA